MAFHNLHVQIYQLMRRLRSQEHSRQVNDTLLFPLSPRRQLRKALESGARQRKNVLYSCGVIAIPVWKANTRGKYGRNLPPQSAKTELSPVPSVRER